MPAFESLKCLRCHEEMSYVGKREFHEGPRLGVFGELFELLVNKEKLYVYICPSCSKIEFFADQPIESEPLSDEQFISREVSETACLSCGAEIPSHRNSCPNCGWSWELMLERSEESLKSTRDLFAKRLACAAEIFRSARFRKQLPPSE